MATSVIYDVCEVNALFLQNYRRLFRELLLHGLIIGCAEEKHWYFRVSVFVYEILMILPYAIGYDASSDS